MTFCVQIHVVSVFQHYFVCDNDAYTELKKSHMWAVEKKTGNQSCYRSAVAFVEAKAPES